MMKPKKMMKKMMVDSIYDVWLGGISKWAKSLLNKPWSEHLWFLLALFKSIVSLTHACIQFPTELNAARQSRRSKYFVQMLGKISFSIYEWNCNQISKAFARRHFE